MFGLLLQLFMWVDYGREDARIPLATSLRIKDFEDKKVLQDDARGFKLSDSGCF